VASERILIVDDQAPMRRTIARMLSSADYEHTEAASVQEAREAMEAGRFDMVLCDISISGGESGLALVEEIEAAPGETAVLIVTGIDDPEVAHKAALLGSNGYLVEPFSANELLINVDHALQETQRREGSAQVELEQERDEERRRVQEVENAMLRLEKEASAADKQAAALLRPLSEAVGLRDLETGAHIRRIGESSALLAEATGMNNAKVEAIRMAAPMHDVGKVAVPDSILLKPGKLDPAERELVERHAGIGHEILAGSNSQLLELAAKIAFSHHEKIDGSGYPQGLKSSGIPIEGRIVAVADVYDALVSDRPYRDALPSDKAIEIMLEGRGTHFDPELLDLFLDRLDAVQNLANVIADEQDPGPQPADRRVGDRRVGDRRVSQRRRG
jgi:putative two-component system response regulator